jgi:hypothetical protein
MATSIDKTLYPKLFGSTALPNDGYAIFADTGISTTNTTTVNYGYYGCRNLSAPTGTYDGNGSVDNNPINVGFADTQLDSLIVAIGVVVSNLTPVTYNTGASTFTPGNVYVATIDPMTPSGVLTFDAQGTSTAQFFVSADSIKFTSGVSFNLINGAQASNIFWIASTGTITTDADIPTIDGILLAYTGSITITRNGGSTVINGNLFTRTSNIAFDGTGNTIINAQGLCYLKGTMILTDQGYKKIELLKVGDNVVTKGVIYENTYINIDEPFTITPITWIDKFKSPNLNKEHFPICIKANAFEEKIPFENLYVSPGHRILIDGKMILAKDLINEDTIFQDNTFISIEYYHFEVETHSSVLANGVLSETYLNYDNRDIFTNGKRESDLPIVRSYVTPILV